MINAQAFTESWFSSHILVCDGSMFLDSMRQVFDKYPFSPKESAHYKNGYTTYFNPQEKLDGYHGVKEFEAFIEKVAVKYFDAIGMNTNCHKPFVSEMWLNRMAKGSSHGKHLHGSAQLCATYYVNADQDASKIVFYNPIANLMEMSGLITEGQAQLPMHHTVTYDPIPGRLLVWPGYLEHEVPENKSNNFRDSVSLNIRLCQR